MWHCGGRLLLGAEINFLLLRLLTPSLENTLSWYESAKMKLRASHSVNPSSCQEACERHIISSCSMWLQCYSFAIKQVWRDKSTYHRQSWGTMELSLLAGRQKWEENACKCLWVSAPSSLCCYITCGDDLLLTITALHYKRVNPLCGIEQKFWTWRSVALSFSMWLTLLRLNMILSYLLHFEQWPFCHLFKWNLSLTLEELDAKFDLESVKATWN